MRERDTAEPRRFAFVEMEGSAQTAIANDGTFQSMLGVERMEIDSTWTRQVSANTEIDDFAGIAARAAEVFGTREKAMSWLRAPLPWLGDKTPLSLLHSSEGIQEVEDVLGRIEQGVW